MILRKLIPNPNRSEAVFTALLLVIISMMIPYLVSKITVNQEYWDLAIPVVLTLVSWDVINDLVGGAIDSSANLLAEKKIDNFKKINTNKGVLKRQELEFLAIIPVSQRTGYSVGIHLRDDQLLEETKNKLLAIQAIMNGLASQDDLLEAIALKACRQVLKKQRFSRQEIKDDHHLIIFQQDIYIYLKAWLMLSIKNDREMDVSRIKQRYPHESSPNQKIYRKTLRLIRDDLIYKPKVDECLEKEHRDKAREIIRYYLSRLIEELKK